MKILNLSKNVKFLKILNFNKNFKFSSKSSKSSNSKSSNFKNPNTNPSITSTTSNTTTDLPNPPLLNSIKSVYNIEREDFYPFLHPVVSDYLPLISSSTSTSVIAYPKDLKEFLEKQKEELRDSNSIEVI